MANLILASAHSEAVIEITGICEPFMKIRRVDISKIKLQRYHPRKDLQPGDPAYDKLEGSIEYFGLVEPLVWNERTGNLVSGYQRTKTLIARGDTSCHVSVVDLSKEDERLLNVALNKIQGDWELEKLAALLQYFQRRKLPLERSGFDEDEAAAIIALFQELKDDGFVEEPPKTPVTRAGDLYQLGKHRILCADSTNTKAVRRLMGKKTAGMMVTDPPYGVNYDPSWRTKVDRVARALGKVTNDDQVDWTSAYQLFPGHVAYVWHAGIFSGEVASHLAQSKLYIRSQLVWSKQHFALSRGHYHCQHEVRKGHSAHWIGGRKQSTVWEISNLNAFGSTNTEEATGHGTQKPVECMERPMKNHNFQLVYDPFLGSGTSIVAAERLKRSCYGLELDPGYCDLIVQRFARLKGVDPAKYFDRVNRAA